MSTIVVPVKLVPDRQISSSLVTTFRVRNDAANHVSDVAWDRKIFKAWDLQNVAYGEIRNRYDLGSQAAVRCIKKVANAYNSGEQKYRRTLQPRHAPSRRPGATRPI